MRVTTNSKYRFIFPNHQVTLVNRASITIFALLIPIVLRQLNVATAEYSTMIQVLHLDGQFFIQTFISVFQKFEFQSLVKYFTQFQQQTVVLFLCHTINFAMALSVCIKSNCMYIVMCVAGLLSVICFILLNHFVSINFVVKTFFCKFFCC